jgi:hypothetical protein
MSRTFCSKISRFGWPTCDATAENMCLWFAEIQTAITTAELDVSGFPDDVTYGGLQPRMLCTVCDHRCTDVLPRGRQLISLFVR